MSTRTRSELDGRAGHAHAWLRPATGCPLTGLAPSALMRELAESRLVTSLLDPVPGDSLAVPHDVLAIAEHVRHIRRERGRAIVSAPL